MCNGKISSMSNVIHHFKFEQWVTNFSDPLDLLRRLSKSQNTVFCGRIQLFLARLFPLSEKSGEDPSRGFVVQLLGVDIKDDILDWNFLFVCFFSHLGLNLQSQFNLENVTVFNKNELESTLGQKVEFLYLRIDSNSLGWLMTFFFHVFPEHKWKGRRHGGGRRRNGGGGCSCSEVCSKMLPILVQTSDLLLTPNAPRIEKLFIKMSISAPFPLITTCTESFGRCRTTSGILCSAMTSFCGWRSWR